MISSYDYVDRDYAKDLKNSMYLTLQNRLYDARCESQMLLIELEVLDEEGEATTEEILRISQEIDNLWEVISATTDELNRLDWEVL